VIIVSNVWIFDFWVFLFISKVAWKMRNKVYAENGLSNLQYKVISTKERFLFNWILINLPEQTWYQTFILIKVEDRSTTLLVHFKLIRLSESVLPSFFGRFLVFVSPIWLTYTSVGFPASTFKQPWQLVVCASPPISPMTRQRAASDAPFWAKRQSIFHFILLYWH